MENSELPWNYATKELTILDILDGVLEKGVIIQGNLFLSIADIDLVFVDLYLIATSVETAIKNNMIKFDLLKFLGEGRKRDGEITG